MASEEQRVTGLETEVMTYREEVAELRRLLRQEDRRVSALMEMVCEALREFPTYRAVPTGDAQVAAVEMAREERVAEMRSRLARQVREIADGRAADGLEHQRFRANGVEGEA